MQTIPFRVEAEPGEDHDAKGGIFSEESGSKIIEVSVDALRASLQSISESFLEAVANIGAVGQYRLKEVSVKLEIGAEGGVNFIGSANIKGSGAIELKFGLP